MSKSKTLNHSESEMLKSLAQPEPSPTLDKNILTTIAHRLTHERNALLFETLVKDPESASQAQLPPPVIKAAMFYHTIANNIASDPALSASDVLARQQALLNNISEQIKSAPNTEQKSAQATSDLAANVTMQNQDTGLST